MTTILAFDTSTEACSVALDIDGDRISNWELVPRQHSEKILPMIDSVLADAGISINVVDALAFGRGPGAFTGVRIATAIVQGLAFAADKPVVPVSTLAALAQQGVRRFQAEHILASIDARMDEVYWAAYSLTDGVLQTRVHEQVTPPETVVSLEALDECFGIGTGWSYCERIPLNPQKVVADAYPHAEDIVALAGDAFARGEAVSAEFALPVYLRDKVAKKRHER
ncbi:tRNA (adenosine(37)-N6)-threonylcarbamoyltransferase complex dimerization subunit type 1 TsaB [Aestuariirhabdus sp. Z084]|uniref:tRNA (adenosine(37)-N6)-threonylcarbamoyltransferase complex dimerization subunit type 1 TsaB n=1 Tax=Aestuariirhabdus haliotis TaxID=2918751 RepID=UPI00201B445C|nr:tRNA (adenosine(37)-N6)-threonylcarbamoyltransferase complex dimerization subunit type 1 TsaB [Aestuariirhabdus haliotis]MCL6417137.1 tRNA (adenosine(37)-N6)-threonylcarbamoyltransferase complex dimerization subunit type 1 TsaB [Aestuariirhabdus haliotis]MCL6421131.1 tRNA (adenosine(37)-N6)-threonylcarbamoyltransferase complex dimerization subunit type 1 TsaB [Aestuariirhabdus haliotis]